MIFSKYLLTTLVLPHKLVISFFVIRKTRKISLNFIQIFLTPLSLIIHTLYIHCISIKKTAFETNFKGGFLLVMISNILSSLYAFFRSFCSRFFWLFNFCGYLFCNSFSTHCFRLVCRLATLPFCRKKGFNFRLTSCND